MPRMQNPDWLCSSPFILFPGAGSSVSSGRFFQSSEVFRKNLPDLPRSSGRVFRVFRQSSEVFRKSLPGLPEESFSGLPRSSASLPRSSGRVFRGLPPVFRGLPEESSESSGRVFQRSSEVFRKSLPALPEESSEVFRKSLSGLPCLPLGSRAKTWCSRQINSFQI